jgi:N-formylglutamate amidohydrolase
MKYPMLIHLPHSSLSIPPDVREDILLGEEELKLEMLKLTDHYTDELYSIPNVESHRNEFSRIVFDPERFRNDEDEVMAKEGMGVIYTHTVDGRRMRSLSESKREELVQRFYDPYHLSLEAKVQKLLDLSGKCLLIDGHSFPRIPLPFEIDKDPSRPDICIGTSEYHTPSELSGFIEEYIKQKGLTVKFNSPFAGTMVPMKYYRKDRRVSSIMIEINRKLYMNEDTGEKSRRFKTVQAMMQGLLRQVLINFL